VLHDYDTAYDNMKAISDSATYPPRWTELASGFREKMRDQGRLIPDIAYADGARNHYDLFLPEGTAKGTLAAIGRDWTKASGRIWRKARLRAAIAWPCQAIRCAPKRAFPVSHGK